MTRSARHPVFPGRPSALGSLLRGLLRRPARQPRSGGPAASACRTTSGRTAADCTTAGFTVIEALIGVVILTASIGGLAVLTARQWSSSGEVDVMERVESAVARDLGWLKTYATYWRMTSGPYNLTCTQAGFGNDCTAFIPSRFSHEYEPDAARCSTATGLADDFVSAASSVTLSPARPFSVASGATTLSGIGLPAGMILTRTITTGKNLVFLSYSLSGTNAATYGFRREAALRPEATGWCP